MADTLFLTLAEVIEIHADQIHRYGGQAGQTTVTLVVTPGGEGPLVWRRVPPPSGGVATAHDLVALRECGVPVDVLVHSGRDEGEELDPDKLEPHPRTVVTTLGANGGRWDGEAGSGTWEAKPLPGERVDEYGAGDSFAAGLTTGLAAGLPIAEAVELGSRCGAANMTGRGPYGGQLDLR